jgi:hypothetical protein
MGALGAHAAETVTIKANFNPDRLNSPAVATGNASLTNPTGKVPNPLTHVAIYGPSGIKLDLRGVAKCNQATLEKKGPQTGCPRDSIMGFGGGAGVFELAGSIIEEPVGLSLFRGPDERGKPSLLIYVLARSPAVVELVLKANVVTGPKPYGLGIAFDVPLIPTLPGATDASVRDAFITIGEAKILPLLRVKERKRVARGPGIVTPKRCRKGGWPLETQFSFSDGVTVSSKTTIACPRR